MKNGKGYMTKDGELIDDWQYELIGLNPKLWNSDYVVKMTLKWTSVICA